MFPPGPAFERFLLESDPGFRKFRGIEVLNPYKDPEIRNLVASFCRRFYHTAGPRVLILGINPGRKGGGVTGIPFTDPVALYECCGIPNSLKPERELSSTFIYEMIDSFGGPELFYRHAVLSAVCPVGFTKEGRNFNYYEDDALLKKLSEYLYESVRFQSELGVIPSAVVSLGKENAAHIQKFNTTSGLFRNIVILEHPRFIMQYRRKRMKEYIARYIDVIGGLSDG